MSGTINAAPPVPAAPATDHSKQQAALAKLLRTYSTDIGQGQAPSQLASLAKQINDLAKAIGQNVTLPKAGGTATAAPSAPPTPNLATDTKVAVTA